MAVNYIYFSTKNQLHIMQSGSAKSIHTQQNMYEDIFSEFKPFGQIIKQSRDESLDLKELIGLEDIDQLMNEQSSSALRNVHSQQANNQGQLSVNDTSSSNTNHKFSQVIEVEDDSNGQQAREELPSPNSQASTTQVLVSVSKLQTQIHQKFLDCPIGVQTLLEEILKPGKDMSDHLLEKIKNVILGIIEQNQSDFKFQSVSDDEFVDKYMPKHLKNYRTIIHGGYIQVPHRREKIKKIIAQIKKPYQNLLSAFKDLWRRGGKEIMFGKPHSFSFKDFMLSLLNPYNKQLNRKNLNSKAIQAIIKENGQQSSLMPQMKNFLEKAKDMGYMLNVAQILFKAKICEKLIGQDTITKLTLKVKFNKKKSIKYTRLIVIQKYLNKLLKDLAPLGIGQGLFDGKTIYMEDLKEQKSLIVDFLRKKEMEQREKKRMDQQNSLGMQQRISLIDGGDDKTSQFFGLKQLELPISSMDHYANGKWQQIYGMVQLKH